MSHRYRHLFLNMHVRNSITMMEVDSEKLGQQLQRFAKFDVHNFFILAR